MLPSIMSLLACEGPILYYTGKETIPAVPHLTFQPDPLHANVSNLAAEVLHPRANAWVERDSVEVEPYESEEGIRVRGRHIPITKFAFRASARPEKRPKFAPHVLKILKDSFARNPRPSNETKQELVKQTKLTCVQIKNWFTNRRRRHGQKITVVQHFYPERSAPKSMM